jgi:DNA polymerase Ligase (LigD)
MPRFVILAHDHPEPHWDFMLEAGAMLRTWRLAAPPAADESVLAVPSFDHRLLYLDYEGPVSGGRGRVARWDHGTFQWETEEADRVVVRLSGERLRGVLQLERDEAGWRGRFCPDARTGP